jgi:hypothetical protein
MAAANASTRGQRAAILASPLSEPSGFCLVVDCLAAGCGGERTFGITPHALLWRLWRAARAAWLVTGPVLSTRVRPRRTGAASGRNNTVAG